MKVANVIEGSPYKNHFPTPTSVQVTGVGSQFSGPVTGVGSQNSGPETEPHLSSENMAYEQHSLLSTCASNNNNNNKILRLLMLPVQLIS